MQNFFLTLSRLLSFLQKGKGWFVTRNKVLKFINLYINRCKAFLAYFCREWHATQKAKSGFVAFLESFKNQFMRI